MSGFLYFIPDSAVPGAGARLSVEQLRGLDLGYAFEATDKGLRQQHPNGVGPGDEGGHVVTYDPDTDVRYKPHEQEWRKIDDRGIWLGMWKADPPGPESLRRNQRIHGHFAELAGRQWMAPIARELVESEGQIATVNRLPTTVEYVDGEWVRGELKEEYRRLWEFALKFYEWVFDRSEENELRQGALRDAALCALSTNYRVGPHEIVMLGLFDSDIELVGFMKYVIDWPTIEKWISRSESDSEGKA
jgi:hypothetical protein